MIDAAALRQLFDGLPKSDSAPRPRSHVLLEGGNVFKDTTGNPTTQRINQADVMATVQWLEKISGLDLTSDIDTETKYPRAWLGSTGKKESSGDLDLAVDSSKITKEQLAAKLSTWIAAQGGKPRDWIAKSGDSVHLRTPIKGNAKNGFIQTDFMFLANKNWGFFWLNPSSNSKYKGMYRNILLSSVAKGTVSSKYPQGLRLGSNGLYNRSTGKEVSNDPATVAKILFGKATSLKNLYSVEGIYDALANDPNRDRKLLDFEEGMRKAKVAVPNATLAETTSGIIMGVRQAVSEYYLNEDASPRIPHPEDSIFQGSESATKFLMGLQEVINDPGGITIKWDGGVALFFGKTETGQFFCSDKYMYPKGVYATSIKAWQEYDKTKASGTMRNDLYHKLSLIWSGLESAVGNTRGVFKGDLLATRDDIQLNNGMYIFSPTTVEYRIPVNSKLGKSIQGKNGIVAVHQYNNAPWTGKPAFKNEGDVAILSPAAGIDFSLKSPTTLISTAKRDVIQNGKEVDQFLSGLTGTAKDALQQYFNKKVTGQTSEQIGDWLKSNKPAQYTKLVGMNKDGYLYTQRKGFDALTNAWNSMYRLKVNLADQLEPQIKDFEQYTHGQRAGEGFVFNSQAVGLIKLVNRGVFGAAHFNK